MRRRVIDCVKTAELIVNDAVWNANKLVWARETMSEFSRAMPNGQPLTSRVLLRVSVRRWHAAATENCTIRCTVKQRIDHAYKPVVWRIKEAGRLAVHVRIWRLSLVTITCYLVHCNRRKKILLLRLYSSWCIHTHTHTHTHTLRWDGMGWAGNSVYFNGGVHTLS